MFRLAGLELPSEPGAGATGRPDAAAALRRPQPHRSRIAVSSAGRMFRGRQVWGLVLRLGDLVVLGRGIRGGGPSRSSPSRLVLVAQTERQVEM